MITFMRRTVVQLASSISKKKKGVRMNAKASDQKKKT